MAHWKFASFIEVDKEYRVEGLNIWNHYWYCSDRKVEVIEPQKGERHFFKEYVISTPAKSITFVAGEFSDGQIAIFLKEENAI